MRHHLRRLLGIGLCAAILSTALPAQGLDIVPLETHEALENLLPGAALVARARYGNDGPDGLAELGLGDLAAPWSARADANWSTGQDVDLRLSYDGFGHAALVVGGQELVFATTGAFESLAISARAKGSGSLARLFDVTLNGQGLYKGARAFAGSAASAFDGTLVSGAALRNGFVLRGTLRFAWTTPPSAPGALLVEVRVGRLAPQMLQGCTATPNSTGLPAHLDWWGVTSISSNKLGLEISDGPPGAVCLYLVGGTQQSLPYGSGTLCAGPPIEVLGAAHVLDARGGHGQLLDLSSGSLATGPLAVLPGDTRVFQAWYRDSAAGADVFNLTDSLTATFLP